jgi:hypothetical protein
MKTKILYVLVSDSSDVYLEQAYVSMCSLKHYNPNAHVVLLTDTLTKQTFQGVRKKELQFVDEFVYVELDGNRYSPQQRSRILKTGVRLYVEGDFLFVDCDTLVVKDVSNIDNIDANIAACWDSHALLHDSPQYSKIVKDGKKLGWPVQDEVEYFNSGVIYVKDNDFTRQFYKLWQSQMEESQEIGVNMDQPSFAKINYQMNHPVRRLDDIWNCELKYGIRFLRDAKIIHYLCTNKSQNSSTQFFLLNEYNSLAIIKKNGAIPPQIDNVIRDPFTGIAPVCHCFAGRDVLFFETPGFHSLRYIFDTPLYRIAENTLRIIKKLLVTLKTKKCE